MAFCLDGALSELSFDDVDALIIRINVNSLDRFPFRHKPFALLLSVFDHLLTVRLD